MPEGLDVGDVSESSDLTVLTPLIGTGDEHARALEEQWIEGGLTADTATSMSSPPPLHLNCLVSEPRHLILY